MKTISKEQASYEFLRNHTIIDSRLMLGYDLTPAELLFCKLLLLDDMTLFYEHLGECILKENHEKLTRTSVETLYNKGLVDKRWSHDEELPDDVELTKKFETRLKQEYGFADDNIQEAQRKLEEQKRLIEEIAEEFFRVYPYETDINGKRALLKSCRKPDLGINGAEQLKKYYLSKIKNDEMLHKKIVAAIKKNVNGGKANHPVLSQNIVSFVDAEGWNDLFSATDFQWDNVI